MRRLVVGGTGLLGSALTSRWNDAVASSRRTGYDFFTDDANALLAEHDPETVVFAAAVESADVPRADFDRAVEQFVDACRGRRLVYVSSDAVFDGTGAPYAPTDPRSPSDSYGRRLAAFEDAVATHENAAVVRPSYVYAGDPLSPRLAAARDALADGSYERFDDVYRSPAHANDVAAVVAAVADSDVDGPVHVPGPRLSVYEFHRRALDALGVSTDGLEPTGTPEGFDVAQDRSLVDSRVETDLGVAVRAPSDAL